MSLIIYNAFPRAYQNLSEIADQIPALKDMAVDVVLINPIQDCRNHPDYKGGSLYSMADERVFLNQYYNGDIRRNEQDLALLSNQADIYDICLMFDLVMNQVSNRLPFRQKNPQYFQPNKGHFDYKTVQIMKEVFDKFFKPFIERYVLQYGFSGIRIDYACWLPKELQKMAIDFTHECCQKRFKRNAIVLGEYLGAMENLNPLKDFGVQYTVITNSTFWSISQKINFEPDIMCELEDLTTLQVEKGNIVNQSQKIPLISDGTLLKVHCDDHNWEMGMKRQICERGRGTIGWTGNHDTTNLHVFCKEKLKSYKFFNQLGHDEQYQHLTKFMKIVIAMTAFNSCGGYFILCGDEFGSVQRRMCWEWQGHEGEPIWQEPNNTYWHQWGGKWDLRPFFKEVNLLLKKINKGVNSHFWSDNYYLPNLLDDKHNVRVVVRNNCEGFNGQVDIIFINVNNNNDKFFFHDGHLHNIREQIMQKHKFFGPRWNDNVSHFIGNFDLSGFTLQQHEQSKI